MFAIVRVPVVKQDERTMSNDTDVPEEDESVLDRDGLFES
jgi:hypothetical protein